MDDLAIVAAQLDREPRSAVHAVARCHLGLPTVIAVPPYLDDGSPFPTRYWLTCPLAVRRIGRLESAGGVKAADARILADPLFAARHDAAMRRYAADRDALISGAVSGPRPTGGVGGALAGVKCLHAHYADHLAGNDNPVGEEVATEVDPLDCAVPCTVEAEGTLVRNPRWEEPRR